MGGGGWRGNQVREDNIQEFVCCHFKEPEMIYSMSHIFLQTAVHLSNSFCDYSCCKGYLRSREPDEAVADRFASDCNTTVFLN